nr:PREDICTED: odorant receptor 46a, isoform A-like [Megachile rotundata]
MAFLVTNLDEFSDNFATTSLILVDCIKHGVLSMRRDSLIELTDMLSKNLFASVTKREIKIRERYDKLVELNTNLYAIFFFGCGVIVFITTTIIDFKKRRLVVPVWLPYNYSSATLYLLTSAYECVAGEYAIMTSAACDCLYIGLLLHICGQIKVLEHRFQTLTEEGYYSLNQCAAHHYNIYQFAKTVNEKFTEVMFFQFAASTSITCLNLYRVLNCESIGMLIETLLYSSATFAQIAYYCWFSNESIKFADEIFYSDWVSWDQEAKKVFLIVITRSARPIEFSCMSILPINLESFMKVILYIATFVQFLDLILNVETQDELSDNIYLMLTMVVACQKMYGLLTSHKNIAALTDILEDEPFQPENGKEVGIREEFDKKAHQHAFFHLAVTEMSVLFYSFAGILKVDEIKLPFRMWLPCDYLPLPLHIVIYMLQVVSLVTGSMVHVACDTLIWGLLIHTCSQLEILGSRLKAIKPDDNQSARLAARYHNRVYRFAKMINEEFKMIIFVQFSVSTLVVCFTLYMLVTTKNSNDQFFKVIMYACSMLVQIFFFCWYGNEVKLKSVQISDTIFGSDWPSLSRETKRILLVIMRRATRSIEFTSVHIVTVNLDAFVNLLKTSYSAFNIMQQAR